MSKGYRLYQFPHSHFCEKARWALDFKGVPFERVNLARGAQVKLSQRLGLSETSLPILETPTGEVIQDSTAILDWLEGHEAHGPSLDPPSESDREEAKRLEELFDDVIGKQVRRLMFSHLVDHPRAMASIFLQGKSRIAQWLFPLMFVFMRRQLQRRLALGPGSAGESEAALNVALDEIDRRLNEGASFLVGGQFSRADLTAAALLSVLTWPPEHEFNWPDFSLMPEELVAARDRLKSRPFFAWALQLYRTHRLHVDL